MSFHLFSRTISRGSSQDRRPDSDERKTGLAHFFLSRKVATSWIFIGEFFAHSERDFAHTLAALVLTCRKPQCTIRSRSWRVLRRHRKLRSTRKSCSSFRTKSAPRTAPWPLRGGSKATPDVLIPSMARWGVATWATSMTTLSSFCPPSTSCWRTVFRTVGVTLCHFFFILKNLRHLIWIRGSICGCYENCSLKDEPISCPDPLRQRCEQRDFFERRSRRVTFLKPCS